MVAAYFQGGNTVVDFDLDKRPQARLLRPGGRRRAGRLVVGLLVQRPRVCRRWAGTASHGRPGSTTCSRSACRLRKAEQWAYSIRRPRRSSRCRSDLARHRLRGSTGGASSCGAAGKKLARSRRSPQLLSELAEERLAGDADAELVRASSETGPDRDPVDLGGGRSKVSSGRRTGSRAAPPRPPRRELVHLDPEAAVLLVRHAEIKPDVVGRRGEELNGSPAPTRPRSRSPRSRAPRPGRAAAAARAAGSPSRSRRVAASTVPAVSASSA